MVTLGTEARRKEEPVHDRRGLEQSLPEMQSRDALSLLGHIFHSPCRAVFSTVLLGYILLSSQRASGWTLARPSPQHSWRPPEVLPTTLGQALPCAICKASAQAEYNPAKQKALWTFQRQSKHDFHHLIHPRASPIKRDYAGHIPNPVSLPYGGQAGYV